MMNNKWNFPDKSGLKRIAELPDPFLKPDGTRVIKPEEWPEQREYLKEMLAHYMYGHIPAPEGNTVGEVIFSRPVYNGKAIAETVHITCGRDIHFNAEIVRPVKEGRVPVFTWNQYKDVHGCPIEELVLQHGYAVMEFQKEQLAEDNGKGVKGKLAKAYAEYDWGVLAMWAWGHMRCADYLLTTNWADPDKLIATGHSRGGKAAMCAAIYDERFALCASSGSGCGGAGCFRFLGSRYGLNTGLCEVAGSIEDAFPFWWTDRFGQFGNRTHTYTRSNCSDFDPMAMLGNSMSDLMSPDKMGKLGDEEYMPFDLHFVKALIAPRALITTDGMGDTWANPYGTQVTWRAAQEVFDFLGAPDKNAIHFRDGGHSYNAINWKAVLDFCDAIFYGIPHGIDINRFVQDNPADPMASAMKLMDWKPMRFHYSWRNPLDVQE